METRPGTASNWDQEAKHGDTSAAEVQQSQDQNNLVTAMVGGLMILNVIKHDKAHSKHISAAVLPTCGKLGTLVNLLWGIPHSSTWGLVMTEPRLPVGLCRVPAWYVSLLPGK